jgi:formylglycine-generating enzyme required for sulfatase activity
MDLWRPPAFAPVARAAKWFLCAFLACGLFLGPGLLATVRSHESILVPRPVKVNPKDGLKYVWVPPGTIQMGCSPGDDACRENEKPSHKVTISHGFWMGRTEVTVGAYMRFARSAAKAMPPEVDLSGRPLNNGWKDEAMPIVNVSWYDSRDFCTWIGGRLPTEAEWEYAARGGSSQARYGPLDDIAWYGDNSGRQRLDSAGILKEGQENFVRRLKENGNGMREVAQKRPNAFGLYDALGNVWEWVNDGYADDYYSTSPEIDPPGPSNSPYRSLRGLSFVTDPKFVRVSVRNPNHRPDSRGSSVGFRCVWKMSGP